MVWIGVVGGRWEEEGVETGVRILYEGVEGEFKGIGDVRGTFGESVQHGHDDLAGSGALRGLGAKADLSGDDERSELALGEVVVGGNGGFSRPVKEAICFCAE
jgi:hypothetical protein